MIRLAIVEDEEQYIQQLEEYLARYQRENGRRMDIRVFRDGDELLEQYEGQFDILLMDIQMRFVDGMTAAEQIRQRDQEVVIMFITNMTQYAIRGYQVDALDYLVKPVEYFAFSRKLDRAISRAGSRNRHYISIRVDGGLRKLDVSHILYIESQGHDLCYLTTEGEYFSRGTIREAEEQMKHHDFYRCNKGCLVNMARVEAVEDGCCLLEGERIPISRARRKEFMEELADYMSRTLT